MEIIAAKVIATGGSDVRSVAALKLSSGHARLLYDDQFRLSQEPIQPLVPEAFALSRAFPNPVKNSTALRYEIPFETRVNLTVYNILGQRMIQLVDAVIPPGSCTAEWDGRDESGRLVNNGIYLIRFDALGVRSTCKIVVSR